MDILRKVKGMPPDQLHAIELAPGKSLERGRQQQTVLDLRAGQAVWCTVGSHAMNGVPIVHIISHAGHIRRIFLLKPQKGTDIIRLHPIFRVWEGDKFSPGSIQAGIPGGGKTAIGLVDHPVQLRISGGIAVAECAAGIGGAVVHQNDLKIPAALTQEGFHAPSQILLHIVNRDDQRQHELHIPASVCMEWLTEGASQALIALMVF